MVVEVCGGRYDGTRLIRLVFPDGVYVQLDHGLAYKVVEQLTVSLCELLYREGKIPDSDMVRAILRDYFEMLHPDDDGAQLRAIAAGVAEEEDDEHDDQGD